MDQCAGVGSTMMSSCMAVGGRGDSGEWTDVHGSVVL